MFRLRNISFGRRNSFFQQPSLRHLMMIFTQILIKIVDHLKALKFMGNFDLKSWVEKSNPFHKTNYFSYRTESIEIFDIEAQ
jgi:hypothetical protein